MIVHHLSATTLCPLGARLVNGHGGWLARGELVCHCWLIETDDGLVLVDTGIGRADLADPRAHLERGFHHLVVGHDTAETQSAWHQVKRLGFDPADVRHIVPTHLDLDHAGGLVDFPAATVHVHRREHEGAIARRGLIARRRYQPRQWAHQPRWDLRDGDGEPWFGFAGVRALDGNDDLLLVPLPGHTHGHCGVAVRTGAGWKLHAGDAYFFHGEVAAEPRCPIGLRVFQRVMAVDNRQRLANRDRLRALVGAHGGEIAVHSAHCPVELARFAATATPSAGTGAAATREPPPTSRSTSATRRAR